MLRRGRKGLRSQTLGTAPQETIVGDEEALSASGDIGALTIPRRRSKNVEKITKAKIDHNTLTAARAKKTQTNTSPRAKKR